jgi:hypothetical protein
MSTVDRDDGNPKMYLGDGAYAEFDGYTLIVTTENGIRTTNSIALEPDVWNELVEFARQFGFRT